MGRAEKFVRTIKARMQASKCKVRYDGKFSEECAAETGFRQGDAMSSWSSSDMTLDLAVREVSEHEVGLKAREKQLVVAAYADAMIIAAESEKETKKTTQTVLRK